MKGEEINDSISNRPQNVAEQIFYSKIFDVDEFSSNMIDGENSISLLSIVVKVILCVRDIHLKDVKVINGDLKSFRW